VVTTFEFYPVPEPNTRREPQWEEGTSGQHKLHSSAQADSIRHAPALRVVN